MKYPKTKTVLYSFLFSLFVIAIFSSAIAQVSYSFIWSPTVSLGLSSYNTKLTFSNNMYIGSFQFYGGTQLRFSNIKQGSTGANINDLRLSTQTSNVTLTSLGTTTISYNVTGAGTQTIYFKNMQPVTVTLDGTQKIAGDGWTYTSGTTTITGATSTAAISYSSGGVISPGFTSPLFQYLLEGDYLYFVVACYTTVLGNTFFGIIVFFVSAVVYLKTRSLFLTGIIYMLFGPTYLVLFWDFSFLAVIFTVIGVASLFVEFVNVWRHRI